MISIFRGEITSDDSELGFDIVEEYIRNKERRLLPPPEIEELVKSEYRERELLRNSKQRSIRQLVFFMGCRIQCIKDGVERNEN